MTIGIVAGLAALLFIAIIALLIVPDEVLFGPGPTATSTPTPLPTPTATIPGSLPTPSFETPVSPEPTPTYTRLPTVPPTLTKTPSPTVVFDLPEPEVRPTDTPIPPATSIPPTNAPPTATLVPGRQYTITFEADETAITNGECTDLRWNIQGAIVRVQLGNEFVTQSGEREVCPKRDTTYTLSTQLQGSAQVDRHTLTITVTGN